MSSEGCHINGGNWSATSSFGYAPSRSLTQVKERLRGTKIRLFSTHVRAPFGPFAIRNVCEDDYLPVENRKRRPQIAKTAVDKHLAASMTSKSPSSDLYLCGKTSSDREETSHVAEKRVGFRAIATLRPTTTLMLRDTNSILVSVFRRCSYVRSTTLR